MWHSGINEFCWREPSVWLSDDMVARAAALPVLVDHPDGGALSSQEFAKRCVGLTIFAYVRDEELWAVAQIVDAGANAILLDGLHQDTSPAVTFAPGTGVKIDVDGKPILVEPEPMLLTRGSLVTARRLAMLKRSEFAPSTPRYRRVLPARFLKIAPIDRHR